MARRKRDEMEEWTDDVSQVIYRCPKVFMKCRGYVNHSKKKTTHATAVLEAMNIPVNEANLRHLRQATAILRMQGVLVISVHSKGKHGGYFLATPDDSKEVERYCSTEEKIGRSMIVRAGRIREKFAEMVRMNNKGMGNNDDDEQGDLFPKGKK